MKTPLALFLLSIALRADVRICEEQKSGDVTAVICPQTLNTLLWLPMLPGDAPGVMNLSLKTANPFTSGFRVTVTYYRSLDMTDVASFSGFLDAAELGQYATLPIVTGQIGGVKSIEVSEVPRIASRIVFGAGDGQ
jgi:hypothetical protein